MGVGAAGEPNADAVGIEIIAVGDLPVQRHRAAVARRAEREGCVGGQRRFGGNRRAPHYEEKQEPNGPAQNFDRHGRLENAKSCDPPEVATLRHA
jgi:hypothetical protein